MVQLHSWTHQMHLTCFFGRIMKHVGRVNKAGTGATRADLPRLANLKQADQ